MVRAPRPAGGSQLFGVTATSPSNAWAVGFSDADAGIGGAALAEHWNGRAWRQVAVPRGGAGLEAVAALSATRVWAVGARPAPSAFTRGGTAGPGRRASAPSRGSFASLQGVAATSAASAWAVGGYETARGFSTLIEHWNGKTWKAVTASPARVQTASRSCPSRRKHRPGVQQVLTR